MPQYSNMSGRRLALLLLAAGLAVRLGYAWHGHRGGFIPTSVDQYEDIARNLLDGKGYSILPGVPTARREPAYPLFIASVYALGGGPGAVVVLLCLLSTAAAAMAGLLARRLAGGKAGLAALAICAFHPQLIYYSAYMFRDTFLVFLFTAMCLASSWWSAEPGDRAGERGALAGGLAAAGLGVGNSAHLPALALAGVSLWFAAPPGARARRFALFAGPLLLAFGLWTARNAAVFGRFIPGSTHGGTEFYQALVVPPEDLGTPRQTEILAADPAFQAALPLPEVERASVMAREGFRWIARNPGTYAGRALAGVAKFWRPWPYKRAYHHSYAALVAASLLSDLWLVPLALFGLWSLRRRWREAPAVWAGAVGLTAVFGAVHAVIRYRLPLVPACAAVAAAVVLSGRKGA